MKTLLSPKDIQRSLRRYGYAGAIDGVIGPRTKEAIKDAIEQRRPNVCAPEWPIERQLVAYQQMLMADVGADVGRIDGFIGPQTEFAFEQWQDRTRELAPPEPEGFGETQWPRQKDVPSFYGTRGQHQVRLRLPYNMKLAWDKKQTVKSFFCHEKVADVMHHCLQEVLAHYGPEQIKKLRLDLWGGCFNNRRMKGSSAWSMHAWGIALDMDPERNRYRWTSDQAAFAKPEYEAWWAIWEEAGAISLGRERNFDWMHLQFARL